MTITSTSPAPRSITAPALAAGTFALILLLVGSFVDVPFGSHAERGWGIDTERQGLGMLAAIVVLAAAGTLAVFGVVVRLALRREAARTATLSLVVAAIGAATIVVFWTGLPVIMSAAAAVLALDAKTRLGRGSARAASALAIAVLTSFAATYFAFAG